MTIHVETSDLSTAAVELREVLDAFDITQRRVARWFDIAPRSIRRWLHGSRRIPRGTAILFNLMATQAVTADQVEQAAARMNGSGTPKSPAPRHSKLMDFCSGGSGDSRAQVGRGFRRRLDGARQFVSKTKLLLHV